MITFVQTPGLVDVYEAPRLMRIACMMRSAGWVIRYAYRAGNWGRFRWRWLWEDSNRRRWNNYWCCDGMDYYSRTGCGCQGMTTAEYYTLDDWREASYSDLYDNERIDYHG